MEADLAAIKVALAVMSNAELDALIEATYKVEQIAPGLLAWLGSACVWQLQRRNGYHFELQPPEAAIPPEEDDVSIDVVIALRDSFREGITRRAHGCSMRWWSCSAAAAPRAARRSLATPPHGLPSRSALRTRRTNSANSGEIVVGATLSAVAAASMLTFNACARPSSEGMSDRWILPSFDVTRNPFMAY